MNAERPARFARRGGTSANRVEKSYVSSIECFGTFVVTSTPQLDDALRNRAEAFGVLPSYVDAFDREQPISSATIRTMLGIMGVDVSSDEAAITDLDARRERPWTRGLEPVTILTSGQRAGVALSCAAASRSILHTWNVALENGTRRSGAFTPRTRPAIGSAVIGGVAYERFELDLGRLPLGYHHFEIEAAGAVRTSTIVVAPDACYLPEVVANGARVWGIAVQLYGLHSERDAGIGDFADLQAFVSAVADAGGAMVGVSPLHDVAVEPGRTPSPYSPRSRLDVAALYLDVRALPGFVEDDVPQALRDAAKASPFVDYGAVAAYVDRAIDAAHRRFRAGDDRELRRAFKAFVDEGGITLRRRAIYAALANRFRTTTFTPWQQWPAEFRDPESAAVEAYGREAANDVDRALFVQWQADVQLARVAAAAARMPIGLYRDVAVGAGGGGTETWAFGPAMLGEVNVGAPPDLLNRDGQNWGVAPFDPVALREAAYAPFAALLRANMRHAGAIRIDHVMALARLWLVPQGATASAGAYVRYRLDEMLAVLSLESVRARCLVVGEDLGTVPAGFREKLATKNILSYRLFTFEIDAEGGHVPPQEYPRLALVSSSTHDLAPIASHVSGYDVGIRESIGLLDETGAVAARADRVAANVRLFDALASAGTPAATIARWRARTSFDRRERERIVDAVAAFLSKTPSAILMLPLEDVLGDLEQPNVPTTIDEHPNWRRRAIASVESIVSHRRMAALGKILRERNR